MHEDIEPQTRKRKAKAEPQDLDVDTFVLSVVQGLANRNGPGWCAPNSMLSLEANILKGYKAANRMKKVILAGDDEDA